MLFVVRIICVCVALAAQVSAADVTRFSPDGRYRVCAEEAGSSGATTNCILHVSTRVGDDWVEKTPSPHISSTLCKMDFELTNEGIIAIYTDEQLNLVTKRLIPYGSGESHRRRTDPYRYDTPLVEAAEAGELDYIRELLSCPAVNPGEVDCYGQDATMVTDQVGIIALVCAARGANYSRLAALQAARDTWQEVADGKRKTPCRCDADNALKNIQRALQEYTASAWASSAPVTQKDRELCACAANSEFIHIRTPEWSGEEPCTLYSSRVIMADGEAKRHEVHVAMLSEDGMTLTLLTRHATIGQAGYTYTKEQRHAAQPYVFRTSPEGMVNDAALIEHWQVDPASRELLRVTHCYCTPGAPAQAYTVWQQPPRTAENKRLALFRTRECPHDSFFDDDPEQDPRYAISPDGKHAVLHFHRYSGAASYGFIIFTREGEGWVQEPQLEGIGTRDGALDFELTNEGIIGIHVDDKAELVSSLFIPYPQSSDKRPDTE